LSRSWAAQGYSTHSVPFLEGLRGEESARTAATELLTGDDPPSAIFLAQILFNFGVMQALKELGRSRALDLVGLGDFTLSDVLDPGITVVTRYREHIGRVAVKTHSGPTQRRPAGTADLRCPCELVLTGVRGNSAAQP
jgi:DNA-binding LacI/PurR family transcriptional regulator